MTGRIIASDSQRAVDLRHVAARFDLEDGRALLYDDARRFGRIMLFDAREWSLRDRLLGLEPLGPEATAERIFQLTRRSRVPMRNWLLDQSRLAGVGNIYANEALFRAGVRPTRRAHRLTRAQAHRLHAALRDVLSEAIEARGTTFSDYRDADGESGGFQPSLRVYGRDGSPCVVCGTPIKRVVLTNRSAFYCPSCQRS
jgi:formamidopyrimidine-DNA glycosylase